MRALRNAFLVSSFALNAVIGCSAPEARPALPIAPAAPKSSVGGELGEALPPLADADVPPLTVFLGMKKYHDPYRSLENDRDAKTRAWMDAQDGFARGLFAQIPARAEIAKKLEAAGYAYAPAGLTVVGQRTFFAWGSMYVRHVTVMTPGEPTRDLTIDDLHATPLMFPSRNADRVAVTYFEKKQQRIRVIDVVSGTTLEALANVPNTGIRWAESNKVFFYVGADADDPDRPKIVRHVIGEPIERDRVVFGKGTPSAKFVEGWTSEMRLGFALGKKTMTIFISRQPPDDATRAQVDAGPPPMTILVSPLDANAAPAPTFLELNVKGYAFGFGADGDAVILGKWPENGKVSYARADAARPFAAPVALPGVLDSPTGMYAALDATYFSKSDTEMVRFPKTGGAGERITLPGRLAWTDANPFTAGVRVRLLSATQGGWYAVGAGGRVERLALDPKQPELDGMVEEHLPLPDRGGAVELVVVHPSSARPDGSHPTELMRGWAPAPHAEMREWFARGGIVASCPPVPRLQGRPLRQWRELERSRYRACAVALLASNWTVPARLGALATHDGAYAITAVVAAEPSLFGALALEDGLTDESMTVGVRSALNAQGAELEASVPYLDLVNPSMPPVYFAALGDPNALRQGAKLVARLNAADPSKLVALFRLPYRREGEGRAADAARSIANESDEEAFLLWALTGNGRDHLPNFVRRPVPPAN